MSVPRWKKWLSYLREIPLETTASDHNPELKVSLHRGRMLLTTQGAIYSYGDLYSNFFDVFRALDFERLAGREVLLLGLGLGSVPEMLERRFGRTFRYTAVEWDETVVWLAHHYVLQDLSSPVELVTANALDYVARCPRTFDLICMDVFQDDRIPPEFERAAFLLGLKACLAKDGLLVFNRLSLSPEDKRMSRKYYREVFLSVFPQGGYLDVRTNWMLLNRPEWVKGSEK